MALKILLADDSMTAQNLGKKILTDAGYDVVTVSNGAAAVRKIAEIKPQVCILDIYMPGYTGLEVCARIKNSAQTSRVPVLLTVGKMEPYKPEEGARVRADGVIVKPFEATELLRAVQRFSARNQANRPVEPAPLGPPVSVEKTVRLTREQIQQMMDPDSQHWRQGNGNQPLQVPSEMASAPKFDVDDVLSTLQAPREPAEPASAIDTPIAPFLATLTAEPVVHDDVVTAAATAETELPALDLKAIDSAAAALPGFVDYVIAAEASAAEQATGTAVTLQPAPQMDAPLCAVALQEPPAPTLAAATLDAPLVGETVSPVVAPVTSALPGVPELATTSSELPPPSLEDTQKIDPEALAAARRASLAAEISLRMEKESPDQPTSPAKPSEDVTLTPIPPVSVVEAVEIVPEQPASAVPLEVEAKSEEPVAAEPAPGIPAIDANLETAAPVSVHPAPDPNLQTPESDQSVITPEVGLEPTSRSEESDAAQVTTDPGLTAYEPLPMLGPTNGTEPHADTPGIPVTHPPVCEGQNPNTAPETPLPQAHAARYSKEWTDVPEEIAAALDSLGGQTAVTDMSGSVVPMVAAQPASVDGSHLRCWVADEIAVPEAEISVSLMEEMQRSKSLREQKPAEVAPIVPEATVRDDQKPPDSKVVPGAGGTARSIRDVAPASELAAAMAAAFGGALPSADMARAEATQPISEEVRRFALGDAYKPKPKAGFSGAAIQDTDEAPVASSINELRLAKAVSRAVDRLKPQIVAEILKELKALEQ